MALIKCTECGKEFSDKATSCPNCGCPTEYVLQTINDVKKADEVKACPFCGSVSIDAEGYCNDCGMKMPVHKKVEFKQELADLQPGFYVKCPECGTYNPTGTFDCPNCNHKFTLDEYQGSLVKVGEKKKFNGVYRISSFGQKTEVYCPRCGSENCSIYHEQKIIPGKSKTSYTMNLNPFKPFTIMNKKEKVIKRDRVVTESKFVCNDCGKIFS